MKPSRRAAALLAAAGTLLAACAPAREAAADTGPLQVMAAIYPLQYVTAQVGGDHVAVRSVTPPGVDAHDLELSPYTVARLDSADLVVYLSGFQAAVDDAVTQTRPTALDVAGPAQLLTPGEEDAAHDGHGHAEADGAHDDHAEADGAPDDDAHADAQPAPQDAAAHDAHGHDHGGVDPHFWLDPLRLADVGVAVADELARLDPAHAADYQANAARFTAEQEALDAEFTAGLAHCASRTIVVSHQAFGYLAERYDLTQVPVAGLDPESEPSPARVAQIAADIEAHGVRTIFAEPGFSAIATTLAEDLGVHVALLDPLDVQVNTDVDYRAAMHHNLETLQEALRCA
ncbi:metal ABC transporter solute-binding protein, Zn/Mn family [Georgenia thermotolerans]|nr:metal ABC transporter substrate-binding protein [Georgenia thermotolerans]